MCYIITVGLVPILWAGVWDDTAIRLLYGVGEFDVLLVIM